LLRAPPRFAAAGERQRETVLVAQLHEAVDVVGVLGLGAHRATAREELLRRLEIGVERRALAGLAGRAPQDDLALARRVEQELPQLRDRAHQRAGITRPGRVEAGVVE